MKLRDRLYEIRFRLRYAFTKKGRIAEHTNYVFEQHPYINSADALAESAKAPDNVRYRHDELAGFASRAEFDEYVKTELPGTQKGHISTWLHWTPLMAIDRTDKESE